MKKMIQSFISLLMAVSVFNQSVMIKAEEAPPDSGTAAEVYVNPLYPDVPLSVTEISPDAEPAEDEYLESVEEAGEAVREGMRERLASIAVRLKTENSDYSAILDRIRAITMEHTGSGKEGDYIAFQYNSISTGISYSVEDGMYFYTFTFSPAYYTNAEQERAVDEKAAQVLEQLEPDRLPEYRKIKAIYDYITDNVTYEYTNLDDDSYLLKYTAYAALINGTSVCQGYANLFYRLALDAGLDARIVSGTSQGENHAWNIVKLGDVYYNIDATWDAGQENYSFFLKGRNDFPDHIRSQEYLTDSFEKEYPMADTEYAIIPVSGLTVSPESVSLHKGESTVITASVIPENATDPTVTFVCGNPEIASVDEEGTVTASTIGETAITVTTVDGGYTASSQIKVIPNPVTEIILDPAEAEMEVGESMPITATVLPENADDKNLSWSSFDESVATVEDGLVTAVSTGQTLIVAQAANTITASAVITVKEKSILPESISINPPALLMTEGDVETLQATISPDNATDKAVIWTSSDEEVVVVDDGIVTALKAGSAVITAETVNGLKAECNVTVERKIINPESITLDKSEMTITEGD
ncbi:MAG: Ig-like domain-containing protein, partial [Solobacterium sp.]|nr:Ig-like domain-containing protein [Solobacterium sp.]